MFENIIGNEKNKKILQDIIESGNISHSYIFAGKEGIGKTLFAKEFAKLILCSKTRNEPCTSCQKFDNGNNPDFYIIDGEGQSIKNDQIKYINKKIHEKPIQANKKIYIIKNAENMTKEAQNSLLKTLEEPPEYAIIILIANNDNLLLNTIKSRCIKINFCELSELEIKEILEKKESKKDVSEKLLEISEGSASRAIALYGREEEYSKIRSIILNLQKISLVELMKKKEEIFIDKEKVNDVLDYINNCFYKNILDNSKYISCIKKIEQTKQRLNKNSNYDMTIDNLLFSIWEEINGNYNRC